MRIISGTCKGRKLEFPSHQDIKPLTDRIKESLFGIIEKKIPEGAVLDLYAGSGSFGLEALSRGAKKAVFVEKHPEALRCIHNNLKSTGFKENADVCGMDVFAYIKNAFRDRQTFGIIFFDPPFKQVEQGKFFPEAEQYAGELLQILDSNGLMIMRIPTGLKPVCISDAFSMIRENKYGRSTVLFYRKDKNNSHRGRNE
ncbi:16S rRNA (guanine(966)-N(2))-methyltransferase RsmD [Planctomycetota bacterium]